MSPQMMVLGEGRLSLGKNTQHDWTSSCKGKHQNSKLRSMFKEYYNGIT